MDIHHLHHFKIPSPIHRTSTLLHGEYYDDIWIVEYGVQGTRVLGENFVGWVFIEMYAFGTAHHVIKYVYDKKVKPYTS